MTVYDQGVIMHEHSMGSLCKPEPESRPISHVPGGVRLLSLRRTLSEPDSH